MSSLSFDLIANTKLVLIEVLLFDKTVLHVTASTDTIELIKSVAEGVLEREHPRKFEILKNEPNAKLNIKENKPQFLKFMNNLKILSANVMTMVQGRLMNSDNAECKSILTILCGAYAYATYYQTKQLLQFRVTNNVKAYQCANCDHKYDGYEYKNSNKRMMKCGGCKTQKVYYCTKECQAIHWKAGHNEPLQILFSTHLYYLKLYHFTYKH